MNTKNVQHAMKAPVRKVSRSTLISVLNNTNGKFCTTTHVDKNGEKRTMNVIRTKKAPDQFGYLQVWSLTDRGWRKINPQTLESVCSENVHYQLLK